MLLDNIVPMKYATIIMISLSIIIILILFIFMQFSKINQFELNRISLQTEQKEIRLAIESDGNNIRITIQNKIHKPVLRNGQLPETSKKDRQNHGLGMASIFETISRNDGAIDFYEQDGWLIVDVLLPVR